MGWFDHDFEGIEAETESPISSGDLILHTSANPFFESAEITVISDPLPNQLNIYDLSGRIVRTLDNTGDRVFLWNGCDACGNEVPSGSYIIRGASEGLSGTLSVVKL